MREDAKTIQQMAARVLSLERPADEVPRQIEKRRMYFAPKGSVMAHGNQSVCAPARCRAKNKASLRGDFSG
jgi:hypothetical protein